MKPAQMNEIFTWNAQKMRKKTCKHQCKTRVAERYLAQNVYTKKKLKNMALAEGLKKT